MSRDDLLEMQKVMRERQQEDYKKKAGWKVDETKGVRYQTILPWPTRLLSLKQSILLK